MNDTPTIPELVDVFARGVIDQENCADAETGNECAKLGIRAFETLVEIYADAGREGLTVLLKHDHPAVKCRAAAFLLRYAHDDAMAVLKELEAGDGITSLKAEYCIRNWENGTWELDLEK